MKRKGGILMSQMELRQELLQTVEFIGVSQEAERIRKFGRRAAKEKAVLLLGETGTGKDQLAEWMHQLACPNQQFVAVDCGAVSEGVSESELFGHVRGAFTGATEDRPGVIALAGEGTLFFNEVANMSLRVQAQFLGILDRKPYRPVGGRTSQTVSARIIGATNADLRAKVSKGEFREDLYYRLNTVVCTLAPLRKRKEDISHLAQHFLQKRTVTKRFSDTALESMNAYNWPGNVRELKNMITGADFASSNRVEIEPEHLSITVIVEAPLEERAGEAIWQTLLRRMTENHESFWKVVYEPFMAREITREDVRAIVTAALKHTKGNYKIVTRMFNMPNEDYKAFLNFLRKHRCQVQYQSFRRE